MIFPYRNPRQFDDGILRAVPLIVIEWRFGFGQDFAVANLDLLLSDRRAGTEPLLDVDDIRAQFLFSVGPSDRFPILLIGQEMTETIITAVLKAWMTFVYVCGWPMRCQWHYYNDIIIIIGQMPTGQWLPLCCWKTVVTSLIIIIHYFEHWWLVLPPVDPQYLLLWPVINSPDPQWYILYRTHCYWW